MRMYHFEHGYIDGDNNINLHYDIQHRKREIEGRPDDYLCINDGIDKTCCELSVFLAHRETGSVYNYITKLTTDDFPLKCEGRLVGNVIKDSCIDSIVWFRCSRFHLKMECWPYFRYEPKETDQEEVECIRLLKPDKLDVAEFEHQI